MSKKPISIESSKPSKTKSTNKESLKKQSTPRKLAHKLSKQNIQKTPNKSINKSALSIQRQRGIKTKFVPNAIKNKQGEFVILNDVFRTFAVQASFVQYCGRRDIALETKIKPRNSKQIQQYTQCGHYDSNATSVAMKVKDLLKVVKQIKDFERTTHLKPKKLQVVFMQRLNEWERLQNKDIKQNS